MSKKDLGKWIRSRFGEWKFGKFIEQKVINRNVDLQRPPIFIVGLPRTGSTLLYQLMCNSFELSYFSNLANVFYAFPATIAFLSKPFVKKYSLRKFESNYGVTEGVLAPSEAGGVYRYWFKNAVNSEKKIPDTINAISDIFKKPFIWKNLNLSFEIERIGCLFPDALFIHMHRELPYVVQSIYLKTLNGEGVNIDGLTKGEVYNDSDLLESLVMNVQQNEKLISEYFENNDDLYLKVNYRDLCSSPDKELEKIEEKYLETGFSLEKNYSFRKESFPISQDVKIRDKEWNKIMELLN